MVGERIVDRLHFGVVEQFLVGPVCARDPQIRSGGLGFLEIARADGEDVAQLAALHARDYFFGSDQGGAEDAPFEFAHFVAPYKG